jgi:hypothetical protein
MICHSESLGLSCFPPLSPHILGTFGKAPTTQPGVRKAPSCWYGVTFLFSSSVRVNTSSWRWESSLWYLKTQCIQPETAVAKWFCQPRWDRCHTVLFLSCYCCWILLCWVMSHKSSPALPPNKKPNVPCLTFALCSSGAAPWTQALPNSPGSLNSCEAWQPCWGHSPFSIILSHSFQEVSEQDVGFHSEAWETAPDTPQALSKYLGNDWVDDWCH